VLRSLALAHAWFLWHTTSSAEDRPTSPAPARSARAGWRDEDGQATTEYALMLLAAALVALMVVAWATAGGGAGKIGRLFDRVIDAVIDKL
jgi:Flp pilus assembly pilin Flp